MSTMVICPHCNHEYDDEAIVSHQPRCEIKKQFSLPLAALGTHGLSGSQTARNAAPDVDHTPGSLLSARTFLMECNYCKEEFDGLTSLLKHRKICSSLVNIASETQPSSSPTLPTAVPSNTISSPTISSLGPQITETKVQSPQVVGEYGSSTSPSPDTHDTLSDKTQDSTAAEYFPPKHEHIDQHITTQPKSIMHSDSSLGSSRPRRSVQEASASRMSLGLRERPQVPQRKSISCAPPIPAPKPQVSAPTLAPPPEGVILLKAIPDSRKETSPSQNTPPTHAQHAPQSARSARSAVVSAPAPPAASSRKSIGAPPTDMLALLKSRQSCPNLVRSPDKSSRKSVGTAPSQPLPTRPTLPHSAPIPPSRPLTPRASSALTPRTAVPSVTPQVLTRSPSFGRKPAVPVAIQQPKPVHSPPSSPARLTRRSIGTTNAPGADQVRNRLGLLNSTPSSRQSISTAPVPRPASRQSLSTSGSLVTRPSNASL
eukprot:c10116_g1_i1.p1 GENE.c10116_g1_i1~~c10116_g1_i1.p1  ORF type:complete len:485 (+),score=50.56 c10116_g1_i1:228-1682(+)